MINLKGSKDNPWLLKTPPGSSEFTIYKDINQSKEVLVCTVGKTKLFYDYRCIEDLHKMLKSHGEWMELGSKDEGKEPNPGTVEAWGRSTDNPIGGYYGLKKGLRGRFANYIPPLLEELGMVEMTHEKRGNKVRAKP